MAPPARKYRHNGEELTIIEWAKKSGVKPITIRMRLYQGMDIGQAIKPVDLRGRKAAKKSSRSRMTMLWTKAIDHRLARCRFKNRRATLALCRGCKLQQCHLAGLL